MVDLVSRNDEAIKSLQKPEIHRIELDAPKIEVREKKIFLERVVIESSDTAKYKMADHERKIIKAQCEKLYKK